MSRPPTFAEAAEAIEELSLEDQEALLELLKRRLLERRREALAGRVQEADEEYRQGKGRSIGVDEFMRETGS